MPVEQRTGLQIREDLGSIRDAEQGDRGTQRTFTILNDDGHEVWIDMRVFAVPLGPSQADVTRRPSDYSSNLCPPKTLGIKMFR